MIRVLIPILLFVSLAVVLMWFLVLAKNNNISRPYSNTAPAAAFPPQSDEQGEVIVTVTPGNVSSKAETWSFDVLLDTHSVELNEDMVSVAVLTDNNGEQYRATGWRGDGPGGHHREGTLLFKPITPMPTLLTLKLSNLGGIGERTFTWQINKT